MYLFRGIRMKWLHTLLVKLLIKVFIEMKPIDPDDHLMTWGEWLDNVRSGNFIDYDGHGYLATKTHMSDIRIVPSDLGIINYSFTHVVWYNR